MCEAVTAFEAFTCPPKTSTCNCLAIMFITRWSMRPTHSTMVCSPNDHTSLNTNSNFTNEVQILDQKKTNFTPINYVTKLLKNVTTRPRNVTSMAYYSYYSQLLISIPKYKTVHAFGQQASTTAYQSLKTCSKAATCQRCWNREKMVATAVQCWYASTCSLHQVSRSHSGAATAPR